MGRYLNILSCFWGTAIAAEMEYRANFVLSALGSLIILGGALFTLLLFYSTGYVMGGWSLHEAMMVVACYTILDGFQQALLAPNRTQITELVREGKLDFVLLKPLDSQLYLSLRRLSLWGLPNILLGSGLLILAASGMETAITLAGLLLGLVAMGLALVILYALGYLLSTLTVWLVKMDNITLAMQALLEAGRYPVPAYPMVYRIFFTLVVPVAFMTSVPAQSFFAPRQALAWVLGSAAVAGLLLLVSCVFWRFALRSYTSASS